MSGAPDTAILLAAGMGTRLRGVWNDGPKGFVRLGGETLIERSLRLLRERGIERSVIVVGYCAEAYEALAGRTTGVEVVHNDAFATTGSMTSLAVALERVDDDFLLLESDLFYEARALDTLLARPERDVLLASGPTAAGDEVWVEAPEGLLRGMSKRRDELGHVAGELVGVVRVSRSLGRALAVAHRQLLQQRADGQVSYETDALVEVAQTRPVHVEVVEDLLWGELDDEAHWQRLHERVYPDWVARCREAEAQGSLARPGREERVAMKSVERRVLLNPGPATTTERVKQALVIPDVCPREDEFCALMQDVRERMAGLVGDPAEVATIPVVGSGTTALEAALVTFVPQDGGVVILDNGDYGTRMVEIARVQGIRHATVSPGWGQPPDLAVLEAALRESAEWATHLFFVHHETSSGLLNPLEAMSSLAREYGLALLVDAVSSFASLPLHVGPSGVDVLVTSSNKCVQGMAGLGLVIARRSAVEEARRVTPRSHVFDLVAEYDQLEKTGQSRFTMPPQVFSALREALLELEEEGGVEARRRRHVESMRVLVAGLEELGFELLLEPSLQSEILVAIREPDEPWYDFRDMHDALYAQGFTIYPGKPGTQATFRLAVLGAIDSYDVRCFLETLAAYLEQVRGSDQRG